MTKCSEIERQTAVSNEPTGICHSKRQQIACCICRQNSWRLHEFSNHPQLDKKTGGEPSEWEKWKMTTKLCELNSFHSHKEKKRKKQEVTSKMAYFKVWKCRKCVLSVEHQYGKTVVWASLGVKVVGHASRLWWTGFATYANFGQPELV